ncbi:MAG: alpha-hydroxy acid oxidase [Gammaproteobacteria bacterium]|jgi:isopentenyl diphosphate isomerase/L-lactate dehydrogenase-like FMN-dependent dehydrogenase|nr:alpha-hydroxy acid oxidase [Gammaproteobacteria bacterium]MDG2338214.1 alpha-hydroxy acid oxidase [Gammaproteobacteria bacterium]
MTQRREFLKFLAASPLLTSYSAFAQEVEQTLGQKLTDPSEVINVFEMEAIAREKIPPAHLGYLSTGVDSDLTLRANRAGFSRYYIKPRRLVDVSQTDTSVEVLGSYSSSPIILCPVGSQGAYHADAELGTARAAAAKGHHMVLSTTSSTAVEKVVEARGAPIWHQLYSTNRWDYTVSLLQRAEAAGCTSVCLTIDLPGGRNTETSAILARQDTRNCDSCHTGQDKPMFDGLNMRGVEHTDAGMTWSVIARMKEVTNMNIVIKGVEVGADAALAVQHGADAIWVSNHGGRATETGRGTIECLPEIVSAVNGRIPVIVDGGFRRGTDIYKALALGASAVGIGRPYCYGLGAFGQAGVERVLGLLNRELLITMQGSGTPTISSIGPDCVQDNGSRMPRGSLVRDLL